MKPLRKKRFFKIVSCVLLVIILLISSVIPTFAAQNYDGGVGVGGGGSSAVATGTYSVHDDFADKDYDKNIMGLRFSVYNIYTGKSYGSIDVYRSAYSRISGVINHKKASVKYNHKELENNWTEVGLYWTTEHTFYYDSSLGIALPETTSDIELWQWDSDNTTAILGHIGNGAPQYIEDFETGDRLMIEPIYPIAVANSTYVLTVAEIAVLGAKTYGTGSISSSTEQSSWRYIANQTNKFFPGSLMTTSGDSGLYAATSQPNSCIPFSTILTGGYGLSVVWNTAEGNNYYLDLNGLVDGNWQGHFSTYGTADVYINGVLMADDVYDYWTPHPYGSSYEIKDIKSTTGHSYNGVAGGSISGTITGDTEVVLNFTTNSYTVTFDPNGGTLPNPGSNIYNADNPENKITIPYYGMMYGYMNGDIPTKTGYTFTGWNTDPSGAGTQVYGADGVALREGTYYNSEYRWVYPGDVTLYAQWEDDEPPIINAVDRWFTLDEATKGKITLEELMKTAEALDSDIGDKTNFANGEGKFTILDYGEEDFKLFSTSGSVTVTYKAVDKAGNEVYRTVTVHIVDNVQPSESVVIRFVRFISSAFFKDGEGDYIANTDGGLDPNSIWITNNEYNDVLSKALSNKKNTETGQWDFVYQKLTFSVKDIKNVKKYINEHGLGNFHETDSLTKFVELYN